MRCLVFYVAGVGSKCIFAKDGSSPAAYSRFFLEIVNMWQFMLHKGEDKESWKIEAIGHFIMLSCYSAPVEARSASARHCSHIM